MTNRPNSKVVRIHASTHAALRDIALSSRPRSTLSAAVDEVVSAYLQHRRRAGERPPEAYGSQRKS